MSDKRALIRGQAKRLFSEQGFKETSIAAIAGAARIAVGSVYSYYPSKEHLFLEIFLEENASLKQACLASVDRTREPKEVVADLLSRMSRDFMETPILRQWYDPRVYAKLERVYREEKGQSAVDFLYDFFLDVIKGWQAQGKIRADIDSRLIMAVFAAIINTDVHKEEIGLGFFPMLPHVMAELVMAGLQDVVTS